VEGKGGGKRRIKVGDVTTRNTNEVGHSGSVTLTFGGPLEFALSKYGRGNWVRENGPQDLDKPKKLRLEMKGNHSWRDTHIECLGVYSIINCRKVISFVRRGIEG